MIYNVIVAYRCKYCNIIKCICGAHLNFYFVRGTRIVIQYGNTVIICSVFFYRIQILYSIDYIVIITAIPIVIITILLFTRRESVTV